MFACSNLRGPTLGESARAAGALRAVAAEKIEPGIEIDTVAAKPALGQHRGNFGRLSARTQPMGIKDHPRQPRRQRQRTKAFSLGRDPALAVERAEFAQQASRLFQSR